MTLYFMSEHFWFRLLAFWVVFRFFISAFITTRILLKKENPGSSIAWIGIVWAMPIWGMILYLCFGVNRVKKRAQELSISYKTNLSIILHKFKCSSSLKDTPLVKMLDKVTQRYLVVGNSVSCLHNNEFECAYPEMLKAIEQAENYISLCSYIFYDDRVGKKFIDALIRAHKRGVQVRVLVDGIGSGYFHCSVQKALLKVGIPCRRFMHFFLPWKMPFINLRNHRKILVVDGKIGFMGGLNIAEQNMIEFCSKKKFVEDTHFKLKGPVVAQLMSVFSHDWYFVTGEKLEGHFFFPEPNIEGTIPARIVTSAPDEDMEKIEYTILQAINLAKKRVVFMTPYFIPDITFIIELQLAVLKGINVEIIVPEHSNHAFVDWARNRSFKLLLKAGCQIWFSKYPFNHSKLMVVDDDWSFIGSSNLDKRSFRLNFEVNLSCYDTHLVNNLDIFFEKHKQRRLTLEEVRKWSLFVKLRNSAAQLFMPYL